MPTDVIKPRHVARLLGVTNEGVRDLVRRGKLRSYPSPTGSGHRWFSERDVRAVAEARIHERQLKLAYRDAYRAACELRQAWQAAKAA